jgi:hypothetical protein
VGAAAAGVLLLLGFAITMSLQARRIAKERDRANLEAETSRRVTEFMTEMFKVSDPNEARGNSITAREILDKASKDVDTSLSKDPELQTRMMNTMGNVYWHLGLYSRAQPLLEGAVDVRRRILGPEHPDTLRSMVDLAGILGAEGHYAQAEKLQRDTLAVQRRALGPEHRETLLLMVDLAGTLYEEGRNAEAEKLQRDARGPEPRPRPSDCQGGEKAMGEG